jgi:uncharacterized phage protein (TIGR01671 family)
MNRIPNYRVWHKIEKRFVDLRTIDFELDSIGYDCYREANYYDVAKFDEIVFQQFTGLKDSKGVDIYEGDIIRGKFLDTEYRHLKTINSEVVWVERYASFNIGIEEWRYSGEPVTIIGNIFESKELLNNELEKN